MSLLCRIRSRCHVPDPCSLALDMLLEGEGNALIDGRVLHVVVWHSLGQQCMANWMRTDRIMVPRFHTMLS